MESLDEQKRFETKLTRERERNTETETEEENTDRQADCERQATTKEREIHFFLKEFGQSDESPFGRNYSLVSLFSFKVFFCLFQLL